MKLHVQCDRCKKYTEAPFDQYHNWVGVPEGWFRLRAFGKEVVLNTTAPIGPVDLLLCGDCMGRVAGSIERTVKSDLGIR